MKQQQQATVVRIRQCGKNIYDLLVELKEIAVSASPGQFASIVCGESRVLRRPISICDADGRFIRFIFAVVGEGTKWLSERKKGDLLNLLIPLGNGFRLCEKGPHLFISGGIGAPPVYFACQKAEGMKHVIMGFRSAEEIILLKEMSETADQVSLCTDDGSLGRRGLVTDLLRERIAEHHYAGVYACGPLKMLQAVRNICVERGVPCQISLEARMGCTIGACLVCATKIRTASGEKYLHVCKDGPVFAAEEVIFDA